ncbi:MAG: hypothetical protein HFJ36_03050 [Clostridia bacterium]|nr:hypothetical protein [Clostridia bacterium]
MKKGAKIGIIVGVIAVIIIGIIGTVGYMFFNDTMQKAKIVDEFAQLEQLTKNGNFELDQLKEKTSNIVTTGKYASVEKAAKNYATELFTTAFELRALLEDEKMAKLLTAENYETDGPEFTETKKYISEKKTNLEEKKAQMLTYFDEGKINSYIEAETTDESCVSLYKELLAQDIKMSDAEKKELETSIDKVISMLGTEEEVINFLIENKGKWEVKNNQVMFNNNSLVIKYNSFLTKLRI